MSFEIFTAGGLPRGGQLASSVPSHFPPAVFDPMEGFRDILAFGGSRSAVVRT